MKQEYIIEITFRNNFETFTQKIHTDPMDPVEGDELKLRNILKDGKIAQKQIYLVTEKAFDFCLPEFPKEQGVRKIQNVDNYCERIKDKVFKIASRVDNRIILKEEYFLI